MNALADGITNERRGQLSYMFRHEVFRMTIAPLAATLFVMTGCDRQPIPPGKIHLAFVGMTDSEATFELANGLHESITIRGARTFSFAIQTWPGETGMTCENVPNRGVEEQLPGLAHGGDPTFFDVSPGERVRLVVATTLPQRHKGGTCQFRLVLRSGAIVESEEFHP